MLSIVVPAYNEEPNIVPLYRAIRAALPETLPIEVLFVDDGSTDKTAEQVRNLRASEAPVRLVRFGRNFGNQAALLAGLEAARGRAVITLDCDLQHPPDLLPRLLAAWQRGAKVVQMVRLRTEGTGLFKNLTSALFYRFVNLLSETRIQPGSDYQLLDRTVVDAVLQFKDRQPFLRGLVSWLGFPAESIEYVAPARRAGKSAFTLRRMLRLSVQAITGLSSKPLRYSFYLGLVTALLCLVYSAYALYALYAGKTVPGWTSLLVVITFLGALQLVSMGIVGEYVARIYEQSRGMPRYVVVEQDEALARAADRVEQSR